MTQPVEPQRLTQWVTWLNDDLWRDIHDGLVVRYRAFLSWNAVVEVADGASRVPGTFHRWVERNYLESLAVALRRVTDHTADTRPVSLVRLLKDVECYSYQLTRDWFVSRFDTMDQPLAGEQFRALSAHGADHLDPSIVCKDRQLVIAAVADVKTYVDKHLAHLDANRPATGPKVGQAHNAVATIYQIYCRWFQILTGEGVGPLIAIPWEQIFTMPWITAEEAIHIRQQTDAEWNRRFGPTGPNWLK